MTKSIATFVQGNTLPAHLQTGTGLGNENVDANSLTIPKLDIIQSLSPQKQKSSPKYIEGAEEGKIFDSLSGELYDSVFLINLMYETSWTVFKQRKFGGGFEGSFDTEADARKYLEDQQLDPKQYDVVESGIHKCLMLDENGNPKQPVLIYMTGSKQRISKQWNTAIQLEGKGADRFATVWTLSTIEETNKQGQPYYNFRVTFAGFAGEELYNEAKKNYYSLKGEMAPSEQ
jgi:hypothetical protein